MLRNSCSVGAKVYKVSKKYQAQTYSGQKTNDNIKYIGIIIVIPMIVIIFASQ